MKEEILTEGFHKKLDGICDKFWKETSRKILFKTKFGSRKHWGKESKNRKPGVLIQNFRIKNKNKKVAKISRPTFNECIREQSNHVRVLHKYTQVKNLDIKFLLLSRYFFYASRYTLFLDT